MRCFLFKCRKNKSLVSICNLEFFRIFWLVVDFYRRFVYFGFFLGVFCVLKMFFVFSFGFEC